MVRDVSLTNTHFRSYDPTSTKARGMEQAIPPRFVSGYVLGYRALRHASGRHHRRR